MVRRKRKRDGEKKEGKGKIVRRKKCKKKNMEGMEI